MLKQRGTQICIGSKMLSHSVVDTLQEWQKTVLLFVLAVAAVLVKLLYYFLSKIFEQKVDFYYLRTYSTKLSTKL